MAKEKSKPDKVFIAVIMLWLTLGVGVIISILKISTLEIDKASGLSFALSIYFFLVMAFLIWKIGQGKDWARSTYLFLFIFEFMFIMLNFLDLTSAIRIFICILGIGQIILQIIALVFLYQKQSSEWFEFKLSMTEKKIKTQWYKRWWAIVLFIVLGLIIIVSIFENNSGQKKLKEKYDVLDYSCSDMWGSVDMKSLGNREDQIRAGLLYLYKDCQDPASYSITILEPTKECFYSFNGEIIKLYYNNTGQDTFVISEASKKIIESDTGFHVWKTYGQIAYNFEMKNGISNMTSYQLGIYWGYKDYLENGITKSTLYYVIEYEIGNPNRCK